MNGDNSNGITGDTLESLKAEREDLEKTVASVRQMTRDFDTLTERRKAFDTKRLASNLKLKGPHLRRCVWKGIITPEAFQWHKAAIARKKALGEQLIKDMAAFTQALVRWAEDLEKRERQQYSSRTASQPKAHAQTLPAPDPLDTTAENSERSAPHGGPDLPCKEPRIDHNSSEKDASEDPGGHGQIRPPLAVMTSEVTADTSLLVHFLETGRQQMMTLAEIAEAVKSSSISIEVTGTVMVDVDGSGPKHGDRRANKNHETSYKIGGKSLNADTTDYAVAPRILSWDEGKGFSILKGGDRASISANGKTIEAIVGDFGPNAPQNSQNTTFGEISYKAVEDLGIHIARPEHSPRTESYPITIIYYPEKKYSESSHRQLIP